MQQFLLVFVLFIDCYLIYALENPLHRSINISLSNNSITTNDFDNPEIHKKLNHFINWFTPILVAFSLLIALVCPFLLWILQERCLYRSSITENPRSTVLFTTPKLFLRDPRTKLQKSNSPNSNYSSKQITSYYTPPSSVDHMV